MYKISIRLLIIFKDTINFIIQFYIAPVLSVDLTCKTHCINHLYFLRINELCCVSVCVKKRDIY